MDAHSLARIAELHPVLESRARQFADLLDFPLEIVQGKRSFQLQAAYFAQGRDPIEHVNMLRAGLGLAAIDEAENARHVTNAQPGYGWHEYGLAFDAAPLLPNGRIDWNVEHPNWKAMLAKAPSVGLAEGAEFRTFPDNPHFYPHELPTGPDDTIRYLFKEGGIEAVWDYAVSTYFKL